MAAKFGRVRDEAGTNINTRNVPPAVRTLFKAYCARRGYTMEAAAIALFKKAIKEDLILPEARPKRSKERY